MDDRIWQEGVFTEGTDTLALNNFVAAWLRRSFLLVAHVELIPQLAYELCHRLEHHAILLARDASIIFQLLTLGEGQAILDKLGYSTRPRLL